MKGRSGFTLVEIMIVVAITIFFIGLRKLKREPKE